MPHNQNSPRENVLTKRIAEDIARAFMDVGYPGNDRIAYDQTGNHLECCEVVKAFQGKRWRDIDINTLARESSAIFFLHQQHSRIICLPFLMQLSYITTALT